ncbi:MAG: electron transport complex subunit RsxA [Treponema sp.]|nr:electron transport complex subunit RsxA [Candidatus Treponema equifaecale]
MRDLTLLNIFLKAMLVDNVILVQYLALCPFIGMTKDSSKALGMGIATSFVIVLAVAVTWPLYNYVMVPNGLEFLQTLAFILVIACLVQLVEFYLKKSAPALYSSMGVYLALITTNCAVLGTSLNSCSENLGYIQSIVYALGISAGFVLSMMVMSGIRKKLAKTTMQVPIFMRGTPLLFISAGLLSLAFLGFGNLIK